MDLLTQNSEKGLGGLDRHGEERAGVLALIRQADVTDSYGELLPWRSHQLNSVIPQSCMREVKTKNHRVKKQILQSSVMAVYCRCFVIQVTLSRRRVTAPCLQFHMIVKYCEHMLWPVALHIFFYVCILGWHSHSQSVRIQKEMHWSIAAEKPLIIIAF